MDTVSLLPAVVLHFTLLLPVWQERPFTSQDLNPAPYPIELTETQLKCQETAFSLGDGPVRARAALQLRRTGDPRARELLQKQLLREKDPTVTASVLYQLSCFPPDLDFAKSGLVLLKSPATGVRIAALRYADTLPLTDYALVEELAAQDPQPPVRGAARQVLAAHAQKCSAAFIQAHAEDPDVDLRALALECAMAQANGDGNSARLVKGCSDADPAVRLALVRGLSQAPDARFEELVPVLAKDAHAGVRSGVAEVLSPRYTPKLLPVLLDLAADGEPETRRLALVSLTRAVDADAVKRTLERFADSACLVRTQAEETMVVLHRRINVIAFVGAQIDHDDNSTRYHVARVLGRLGAKEFVPTLRKRLGQEDNPENIAAVVFALAELCASEAAAEVSPFAEHADAVVRTQVARALGAMAIPDTYPVLDKLLFDKSQSVRSAALRAVGRLRDGHFSPALKRVLESVSAGSSVTPTDRADACWAAGRVRPISIELMKRILLQGTTPVVPTEMGPVFEGDDVLVSAGFALADCARASRDVVPMFEKMNVMHQTENKNPSGIGSLMPTPELMEYARQAAAFVQGKPISPGLRPKTQPNFSYRPIERAP